MLVKNLERGHTLYGDDGIVKHTCWYHWDRGTENHWGVGIDPETGFPHAASRAARDVIALASKLYRDAGGHGLTPRQRKLHLYWGDVFNPIEVKGGGFGCSRVSPGCTNCWSSEINNRFWGRSFDQSDWDFVLNEKKLTAPLRARTPKVYFVCNSMDLFHHSVPDEYIRRVIEIMDTCYHAGSENVFLVLTKRPERAVKWFEGDTNCPEDYSLPPNIYFGVTCENQKMADRWIPLLMQIPVAKRWVSYEPALTDLSLNVGQLQHIDWIAMGCESGSKRRSMHVEYATRMRDRCRMTRTPLFVKQLDLDGKCVHDIEKFPASLRVRELPWQK